MGSRGLFGGEGGEAVPGSVLFPLEGVGVFERDGPRGAVEEDDIDGAAVAGEQEAPLFLGTRLFDVLNNPDALHVGGHGGFGGGGAVGGLEIDPGGVHEEGDV